MVHSAHGRILNIADYQRRGPAAVRALMDCELAPGVTVHAAAWAFAMPDAEYERSDVDADAMAVLLEEAGLAWFPGNDDQPAVLVPKIESRFRQKFRALACREAVMDALGTGIRIRRDPDLCV